LVKYKIPIVFLLIGLVYFLSQVFFGNWILPQGFFLGPIEVRYYGIIIALAVAVGYYYAVKTSTKYQISPKQAEDLLFWVIIGGFIGARIYHVFSSFNFYLQNPLSVFQVWNGGLSIYGAVLAGLLSLIVYKKLYNFQLSTFNLLDWLTPSIILGQIIGRFGNLFNYEAFGYPTNLVWKMFVPIEFRPVGFLGFSFFHPWFLYEVFGLIIIFLLLKIIIQKRLGNINGSLFLTYFLLYNVVRFFLEFSRIDSVFIGNMRQNAVASLVFAVLACFAFIFIFLKKRDKVS